MPAEDMTRPGVDCLRREPAVVAHSRGNHQTSRLHLADERTRVLLPARLHIDSLMRAVFGDPVPCVNGQAGRSR